MRALFVSLFCLVAVWCAPQEAQAQAIVLPCVPSGTSCIPVSAANPLPTTGGAVISGATPCTGCASGGVLYNGSGGVTADSGFTYTGAGGLVGISNGTISGSGTGAFFSVGGNWNTSGVVNGALVVNPTNLASGTGSLLANFMLGGVSQFRVDKVGNVVATGGETLNAPISASAATPVLSLFDTTTNTTNALFWFSTPIASGPDLNLGVSSTLQPARFIINTTLRLGANVETVGNYTFISSGANFTLSSGNNIRFQTQVSGLSVISTGYNQASIYTAYPSFSNTLSTQPVSAASTAAGNVLVTAGNASGTGGTSNGGSVIITPGTSTNGTAGSLIFTALTQTSAAQSGTVCYASGTGVVTYDATLGCLTSTMDAKDNWHPFTPHEALALVTRMEAGAYTYKPNMGLPDGPQVGLSAQQIALIDDRLVGYDNNGKLRGVRYQQASALYGPAIRAVNDDLAALRNRIEALEAR